MALIQRQPQRGIYPQIVGVIAVFLGGGNLIDLLPNQV